MKEIIDQLQRKKHSICCDEVKELLIGLGFVVRDGKRGGHKIYTHSGLNEFTSASFNCGHGRNPEIKPAYITEIIKNIRKYEAELATYLESKDV